MVETQSIFVRAYSDRVSWPGQFRSGASDFEKVHHVCKGRHERRLESIKIVISFLVSLPLFKIIL